MITNARAALLLAGLLGAGAVVGQVAVRGEVAARHPANLPQQGKGSQTSRL